MFSGANNFTFAREHVVRDGFYVLLHGGEHAGAGHYENLLILCVLCIDLSVFPA